MPRGWGFLGLERCLGFWAGVQGPGWGWKQHRQTQPGPALDRRMGPSSAGRDGTVGAAAPSAGGHLGHCRDQPGVTQGHPRPEDPEEDWPGFFLVWHSHP